MNTKHAYFLAEYNIINYLLVLSVTISSTCHEAWAQREFPQNEIPLVNNVT